MFSPYLWHHAFLFFAGFADLLNALFVGAPLDPGFLIFSFEPALILSRLSLMFLYNPITISPYLPNKQHSFYPF